MMSDYHNKIAILSVHSSPLGQPGIGDTGGMSIYIRELTRELVKIGHTVDIYTRVQDPVTPEIVELAPRARQIHLLAGEPADIDKLLVYNHAPDFAHSVENFRRQHNLQYDLIFSHYWISGIAGQYLQSWWQVPQMVMFHTLGAVKNAIGIGEDESDLRIEEERKIANYCCRVVASTDAEKTALRQYYGISPDKISVIPCGVNMGQFQPSDKQLARRILNLGDRKIILFVGRIERLKGIDKIIMALPFLSRFQPHLLIVGEDGNRPGEIETLKNLAGNLHLSDSITFTGLVDYERLPAYYNAADVCVFPSHYESFGLVPLESLACGTPVVATDVGDLRHIIRQGETGFILADARPEFLADKIEMILDDAPRPMKDPLGIRNSVKPFGWEHIAGSIDQEFNRLILKNAVST
jgi:D-inositol-3-phosphate glycosyltransferase